MKLSNKICKSLMKLFFILMTITMLSYAIEENMTFRDENIISLVKSNMRNGIIFAASQNSVFKTQNDGINWQSVYYISRANKKINRLYLSPDSSEIIYLTTEDGLYQSKDQGSNWQRLFIGGSDLEKDCLSIAKSKDSLYLGTKQGLFISHNFGKSWIKSSGQFSDSVISSIAANPKNENIIYIACEKGVFKTEDSGRNWKRIYVVYGFEIPSEDYNDYDGDISDKITYIKNIVIPLEKSNRLYVLASKDILFSNDNGENWEKLTNFGLSSFDVRSITVSENGEYIFAATDKGIFKLISDVWERIDDGLNYNDYNDLIIDKDDFLWIGGKGGVFKIIAEEKDGKNMSHDDRSNDSKLRIEDLFNGEPSIEEVQRIAIEYAEVNTNKIKSWRKRAQLKAFFPTISVGYDKNVYGSSSGAMAVGPRDWDIDLSWDVGELIWNSDQTSIDSRSRLTVQLRQDILDQVTHLYYERQRLKAELLLSPHQNKREELNRAIQIQEITASLDALTNGFFSEFLQSQE